MKNTRKLIPALAMLIVSAVLLSTASFAWFTTNKEVTASSMEVKATTGANLYIAKGASVPVDGITGILVDDLGASATSLRPAHVVADGTGAKVQDAATFKDDKDPQLGYAGEAETYTDIATVSATAFVNADDNNIANYAAVAFVSLARKQTTAAKFTLTATCTIDLATESQLNKALRVAVVIDNKAYIANDVDTAADTATFSINIDSALDDNKAYSAALLIWFEGEDSDCTINNATLSNNIAAWSFTSADYIGE